MSNDEYPIKVSKEWKAKKPIKVIPYQNTLVWGKLPRHGWWPARIASDSELKGSPVKVNDPKRWLQCYGDGLYAEIKLENMAYFYEFDKCFNDVKFYRKSRRDENYCRGVEEAVREVAKRLDRKNNNEDIDKLIDWIKFDLSGDDKMKLKLGIFDQRSDLSWNRQEEEDEAVKSIAQNEPSSERKLPLIDQPLCRLLPEKQNSLTENPYSLRSRKKSRDFLESITKINVDESFSYEPKRKKPHLEQSVVDQLFLEDSCFNQPSPESLDGENWSSEELINQQQPTKEDSAANFLSLEKPTCVKSQLSDKQLTVEVEMGDQNRPEVKKTALKVGKPVVVELKHRMITRSSTLRQLTPNQSETSDGPTTSETLENNQSVLKNKLPQKQEDMQASESLSSDKLKQDEPVSQGSSYNQKAFEDLTESKESTNTQSSPDLFPNNSLLENASERSARSKLHINDLSFVKQTMLSNKGTSIEQIVKNLSLKNFPISITSLNRSAIGQLKSKPLECSPACKKSDHSPSNKPTTSRLISLDTIEKILPNSNLMLNQVCSDQLSGETFISQKKPEKTELCQLTTKSAKTFLPQEFDNAQRVQKEPNGVETTAEGSKSTKKLEGIADCLVIENKTVINHSVLSNESLSTSEVDNVPLLVANPLSHELISVDHVMEVSSEEILQTCKLLIQNIIAQVENLNEKTDVKELEKPSGNHLRISETANNQIKSKNFGHVQCLVENQVKELENKVISKLTNNQSVSEHETRTNLTLESSVQEQQQNLSVDRLADKPLNTPLSFEHFKEAKKSFKETKINNQINTTDENNLTDLSLSVPLVDQLDSGIPSSLTLHESNQLSTTVAKQLTQEVSILGKTSFEESTMNKTAEKALDECSLLDFDKQKELTPDESHNLDQLSQLHLFDDSFHEQMNPPAKSNESIAKKLNLKSFASEKGHHATNVENRSVVEWTVNKELHLKRPASTQSPKVNQSSDNTTTSAFMLDLTCKQYSQDLFFNDWTSNLKLRDLLNDQPAMTSQKVTEDLEISDFSSNRFTGSELTSDLSEPESLNESIKIGTLNRPAREDDFAKPFTPNYLKIPERKKLLPKPLPAESLGELTKAGIPSDNLYTTTPFNKSNKNNLFDNRPKLWSKNLYVSSATESSGDSSATEIFSEYAVVNPLNSLNKNNLSIKPSRKKLSEETSGLESLNQLNASKLRINLNEKKVNNEPSPRVLSDSSSATESTSATLSATESLNESSATEFCFQQTALQPSTELAKNNFPIKLNEKCIFNETILTETLGKTFNSQLFSESLENKSLTKSNLLDSSSATESSVSSGSLRLSANSSATELLSEYPKVEHSKRLFENRLRTEKNYKAFLIRKNETESMTSKFPNKLCQNESFDNKQSENDFLSGSSVTEYLSEDIPIELGNGSLERILLTNSVKKGLSSISRRKESFEEIKRRKLVRKPIDSPLTDVSHTRLVSEPTTSKLLDERVSKELVSCSVSDSIGISQASVLDHFSEERYIEFVAYTGSDDEDESLIEKVFIPMFDSIQIVDQEKKDYNLRSKHQNKKITLKEKERFCQNEKKMLIFNKIKRGEIPIEFVCVVCCSSEKIKSDHPFIIGGICENCQNTLYDHLRSSKHVLMENICFICFSNFELLKCCNKYCQINLCKFCITSMVSDEMITQFEDPSSWMCPCCKVCIDSKLFTWRFNWTSQLISCYKKALSTI